MLHKAHQNMINQFGIHLKVKNIPQSLSFYKSFGFKEVFAYGDKVFLRRFHKIPTAPEKYCGVVFGICDSLFEIADGHLAVKPKVFKEKITSPKISAMIHVRSVDTIKNICKKNKYRITVPIKTFPWGTKEIVIKDPDGFLLVFIEKLKK